MSSSAYTTLVTVSETMFPGISVTTGLGGKGTNTMETAAIKLGNQLMSNLPLQVLLYLNVIYFPCWLSVILMVVSVKFHLLNYLYKFVLVTILVAVIVIEIVRLYLGYLGNLTEKVPELAGFWLLTILLQLPLQGFLLFNTDLILVPIGKRNNVFTILMTSLTNRDIGGERDDGADLVRADRGVPGPEGDHQAPGKQVPPPAVH